MPASPPYRMTAQDRAERVAAKVMARLSPRMVRLLAGPPVERDGLTLDPQTQLVLKAMEQRGAGSWAAAGAPAARAETRRTAMVSATGRPRAGATADLTVPGPAGPLPARRYDPPGAAGVTAALVYFHGGGFVFGDLDTHDELCRTLCVHAGVTVVAVDYRLAPEAPFPAAADDCLAAFRWVRDHAAALRVDPARIAVGGDSAGGNLAAVVPQDCRAAGEPGPAFQLLIYPVIDPAGHTRSHELFGEGFFLVQEDMQWFGKSYGAPGTDVRAAPLLAEDLHGLPPAYVATAGFDPLRDEGEAYAAKLAAAGVPTALRRHPGLVHGFANMTSVSRAARDAVLEMAGALQLGLA